MKPGVSNVSGLWAPRRLLFNPGPVSVADNVRMALLSSDMNHREPAFVKVMREVRLGLIELLGGSNSHTCIPLVASGSGATEAIISSLEGPTIALIAGPYSNRMAQMCERLGLDTFRLSFDPLEGIDLDPIKDALSGRQFRSLCFVHHETTTSRLAPLAEICKLARSREITTCVDAISSVFANSINLQDDCVDYISFSANKGLEGLPGLSFVAASTELINSSKGRSRSVYFDLHEHWSRMENKGQPPFTQPAFQYFSVAQAVQNLQVETVAGRCKRYGSNRRYLRDRLTEIGIESYPLPEEKCSSSLLLTHRPSNFDYSQVQRELEARGIVIYTDADTLDHRRMLFSTMGQIDKGSIDTLVEALRDAWYRDANRHTN
jgi:2-aminoethylphosphonate-pyruvate transaminase